MNREETIKRLQELLIKQRNLEHKKEVLDDLGFDLAEAKSISCNRVSDFDAENKIPFINRAVGPEPEKPSDWWMPILPVYLVKKNDYEKEMSDYNMRRNIAETQYYTEFQEKREQLEKEDLAEKANKVNTIQVKYDEALSDYQAAKRIIDQDEIVGTKHKDKETIEELLGYFQEGRADSIKEAINLYHEERHRRKIEEFAQKQVELTKEARELAEEARDYAEEAARSASDAQDSADKAIKRIDELSYDLDDIRYKADDAYDRANNAYYRADEAYSKADEAYDMAWDNSNNQY